MLVKILRKISQDIISLPSYVVPVVFTPYLIQRGIKACSNWENLKWNSLGDSKILKHNFKTLIKYKDWFTLDTVCSSQSSSFSVLTLTLKSHYLVPEGKGVLPEKLGVGVRPKPSPYLRPKSAIFPTLFMTWPKIQNPIYDLTLKSKPCFRPAL